MAIEITFELENEDKLKFTFAEIDSAFEIRCFIPDTSDFYSDKIKNALHVHHLARDENEKNSIVFTYKEINRLFDDFILSLSNTHQIKATAFKYIHEGILTTSNFDQIRSGLFINDLKDALNNQKYNSYKYFEEAFKAILDKLNFLTIIRQPFNSPIAKLATDETQNNTNISSQSFAEKKDIADKNGSQKESPIIPKSANKALSSNSEIKSEEKKLPSQSSFMQTKKSTKPKLSQSSALVPQVGQAAEKSISILADSQQSPQHIETAHDKVLRKETQASQQINRIIEDIYLGRHKVPFVGVNVMNKKGRMESYTNTTYRILTMVKENERLFPLLQKKPSELLQTIQAMLAPKVIQRGYACYNNWMNLKKHSAYSEYLDWLIKDIATTSWQIKAFPFGGTVTTIKYKTDDGSYHKVTITVPRHIARVCNIINQVGDKYTSEQATAKVLAIFQREAEHSYSSNRSISTQEKYKQYAKPFERDFPVVKEHLEYKNILDWLKKDIAETSWRKNIKYPFWGGEDIKFDYFLNNKRNVKTFNDVVPKHIQKVIKIIEEVGEKYSDKEALMKIFNIFKTEFYTDVNHPNVIGRTSDTQQKYNQYAIQLESKIYHAESMAKQSNTSNMLLNQTLMI